MLSPRTMQFRLSPGGEGSTHMLSSAVRPLACGGLYCLSGVWVVALHHRILCSAIPTMDICSRCRRKKVEERKHKEPEGYSDLHDRSSFLKFGQKFEAIRLGCVPPGGGHSCVANPQYWLAPRSGVVALRYCALHVSCHAAGVLTEVIQGIGRIGSQC